MVNLNTSYKAATGEAASLFTEVQRYRRTWIWILLGVPFAGLMSIAAVQWVRIPQTEAYWLSFPSLVGLGVATLLIAFLVYQAHLTTSIDDRGLRLRLFPLQWFYRQIDWQEVEEVYIREYDAISEYGGWGIRYGQPGKSYTISGRFGLQLVLSDERRILIGTHRPIELEQLILRLLYDYELK